MGSYCLAHHWDGADELLPEDALFYTEQQLVEKILQYSALSEDEKYIKREALQDFVRENFDVERIKVQIRIQIVEEVGETYQGK